MLQSDVEAELRQRQGSGVEIQRGNHQSPPLRIPPLRPQTLSPNSGQPGRLPQLFVAVLLKQRGEKGREKSDERGFVVEGSRADPRPVVRDCSLRWARIPARTSSLLRPLRY